MVVLFPGGTTMRPPGGAIGSSKLPLVRRLAAGVGDGVRVGVRVGVLVAVRVAVLVGVLVGVLVKVRVGVLLGVRVGVLRAVGVGVLRGVGVGVRVELETSITYAWARAYLGLAQTTNSKSVANPIARTDSRVRSPTCSLNGPPGCRGTPDPAVFPPPS